MAFPVLGGAEPKYQVCRRARTHLAERVSFVQVEVTFHEDTGRAIDGSKDQAALVTRDWQRDTASERDTVRVRERAGRRGVGPGRLTCAHWEVRDVLVPEGVLVGSTISQQAQSRAADHSHLWPVVRLLKQPFGGQLVVVEGAAAGRVKGQSSQCSPVAGFNEAGREEVTVGNTISQQKPLKPSR